MFSFVVNRLKSAVAAFAPPIGRNASDLPPDYSSVLIGGVNYHVVLLIFANSEHFDSVKHYLLVMVSNWTYFLLDTIF